MAKDLLLRLIGRLSLCFDVVRFLFIKSRRWQPGTNSEREFDQTGKIDGDTNGSEILLDDGVVLYVRHGSLAHSFWRAQELSLARIHQSILEKPIMDFGCGDGSFSSCLFGSIEYGVDRDHLVLKKATESGIYEKVVVCTDVRIPLPDSCVGSIFSNSVLEHLNDLKAMVQELQRILRPRGVFMFTVPLKQYEHDIAKYYGKTSAKQVTLASYHRNLLTADEWDRLLSQSGFEIEMVTHYQPDWFTFWFRMLRLLGINGLPRLLPGVEERFLRRYKAHLGSLVRRSIRGTKIGGNIFVIARKIS